MAHAISMVEVEGVAGIVVGADAGCKAATVQLVGWESIGGFTTVFFRGDTGDVDAAMKAAAAAAAQIEAHVVTAPLHQPQPEAAGFVGFPVPEGEGPNGEGPGGEAAAGTALGIVETRGYGAHVDSNDRMVKAADVEIANVLTVHNRVVCTLITGSVDAVEQAIEAARQALSGSEWFRAAAVLPQPEPEVLRAFTLVRPGAGAS